MEIKASTEEISFHIYMCNWFIRVQSNDEFLCTKMDLPNSADTIKLIALRRALDRSDG